MLLSLQLIINEAKVLKKAKQLVVQVPILIIAWEV